MKNTALKKIRKRITVSAAAAVTALSVLLAGVFDSPAELICDEPALSPAPMQIETVIDEDFINETEDGESLIPDEKKKNLRTRLKERILRLPYTTRLCVALPLWGLGWLITSLLSLLWEPLLSPTVAAVLRAVCVAAILLAAVLATVKAAFPETPIRKILNRKSISTALLGALIFGASGALMQIFLPEYDKLKTFADGALLLAVLCACAIPVLKAERARRSQNYEEKSPDSDRKLVMNLADNVGAKTP